MARMESTNATQQVAQPKRGVLGRLFRRSPKASDKKADHRDRTPSPQGSADNGSREEVPEMNPETTPPPSPKPKKVQLELMPEEPEKASKQETKPRTPRSPLEAAVSGPPKYSWVDIETSAALKVQAAYRRNKVMNDMEQAGHSTSAIRNRSRRRQYDQQRKERALSSLFTCCGAELVLPDFSQEDDYDVRKEHDKLAYEEKKKAKLEHEEKLRNNFGKRLLKKKQKQGNTEEAFEVVE
mmetsp:Transcript_10530/g.20232  ORF Transcript_10530/g.20232 Transcript_10530/m.20232 type:complete len:239 (-) Transcript_10530:103-819(-)|eukprot:scaffold23831_cov180-Amphora_coffeaeformis.AAC.1